MKTHDAKDRTNETRGARERRHRSASWLAGIGAALVVALLIGVSVVVFAEAKQQAANSGKQAPIPPTGTWTRILQGYGINAIVAAANNPATIYACTQPGQSFPSWQSAPPRQGGSSSQPPTILRSSDFGAHWQPVSNNIALGYSCQIAVNPGNSNDVYATGTSSSSTPSGVLFHSTNGGQTWTTIHPSFGPPTASMAVTWSVQQISVANGHLFGIQYVQGGPVHLQPSGMLQPRLATSTDGGQTWTILDTQLASTNMSVRDYAVGPTNSATIYELLGPTFGPIQPVDGMPKSGTPAGISDALYKSTDGGTTWKLLIENLPYGSRIQLAQNTSDMLYVGGVRIPLPYAAQPNHAVTEPAFPLQTGGFNLHMSNDSGTTWHTVATLSQSFSPINWFAGADGKVYTYSINVLHGGSSGTGSPEPTIERYDPASNGWSALTRPPVMGMLLAVTPTGNGSGAVLWLLGENNGKLVLYRYIAQ